MGLSTIDGEHLFRNGTVTFGDRVTLPAGCIGDNQADAANPFETDKVRHRHHKTFAQANGSAAATEQRVVHVGYGAAGSVVAIRAGIRTAGSGGGMSVTVDVKKNGTSILSSVVTINASTVALAKASATVTTADYEDGDVIEVVVTATAGGGTLPQGLFVDLLFDEDPA